jgi:hypothetical protein
MNEQIPTDHLDLDLKGLESNEPVPSFLAVHEALERLGDFDSVKARIVELRVFGGLSIEETAEVLNISHENVRRNWKLAGTWLSREILAESPAEDSQVRSKETQASSTPQIRSPENSHNTSQERLANRAPHRPPFNAEYLLYFLLSKKDREILIGDFIEEYGDVLSRFNKRRADIWFYKQVGGSLFPLLRRALLRVGALVWLGRILRRLIS